MFFLLWLCVLSSVYCKEYKAVDDLNLNQYVGTWYQVYGDNFNKLFQGNGKCSTATYEFVSEDEVSVLNKQLSNKDEKESITGYAYYSDGDCCGYLTVQLEDLSPAPYWVLELGPVVNDIYDYAIVSDNFALSLFVLVRNVTDFYENYNEDVLESLDEFGFNKLWNYPIVMNQANCSYF